MDKIKLALSNNQEWFWMLLLSLYIGLVLNLPNLYRKSHVYSEFGVTVVALDALFAVLSTWSLLSLASLFGSRVIKTVGVIVLTVSALTAYYMWFAHVVVSFSSFKAISSWDLSTLYNHLDYKQPLFFLLFGVAPTYFFSKKPLVTDQRISRRYLYRALYIFIATVGLHSVNLQYKEFRQPVADGRIPINPFGMAGHYYLPSNLFATAGMTLDSYLANRHLANTLVDPKTVFQFSQTENLDDLYLLFVIGETIRSDRMSILGFERITTPLMQKEQNLIAFQATSCNTKTKLSLACMFVRKGGVEEFDDSTKQLVKERNIFNLLKSFGFTLQLYAMQGEIWFYNKVSADSYKIREEIGAETGRNEVAVIDDYLLLDQAKQSLQQHPDGRHIILLHTNGAHYLYTNRYPREFAKFKPECYPRAKNCTIDEKFNSYDNAILYTDYVLASLIDVFRNKKTLMIYAPDHGEYIDEHTQYHGTPKNSAAKELRGIPIIMWASDAFLAVPRLAQGFAAAKELQKSGRTVIHEEIFESVLGCLGFKSGNGGIRPENNWCSH
ncbi:MAG: kdo(2)-lipid A phosphoethanolamine 7''-transferase [Magnetococcales bacterium]|nr:kdo(2)-lipid A phosphoethanolamine 7''-transferase [Magnetococcales bacterium]